MGTLLAIRVRERERQKQKEEREREGERERGAAMPQMVKIEGATKPDRKKEFARGGRLASHKTTAARRGGRTTTKQPILRPLREGGGSRQIIDSEALAQKWSLPAAAILIKSVSLSQSS